MYSYNPPNNQTESYIKMLTTALSKSNVSLGAFTLYETRAKLALKTVVKTVVKTGMFGHAIWAMKSKIKSRKP